MQPHWDDHARATPRVRRAPRPDSGSTLLEVLIAVVLMGTIVASGLALLITTITGTELDRDHSNAHAWLQTASDMLYAREPENCDPNLTDPTAIETRRAAIIAAYQTTIQQTDNPESWPAANIQVVDLWYWHYARGVNNTPEEGWVKNRCTTDLQRLLLRVRNQDGRIVEEVEVIVGGE
jgi:Tfp pilus assembly protein PilV